MKLTRIILPLFTLAAAAVLTGCTEPIEQGTPDMTIAASDTTSDMTGTETTVTTEAETTTETTTTVDPATLRINPLTGTNTMNERAVGKRPVAVMINNIRVSLPQYGIEAADLMYEMPVEGGITRMMGVYADYQAVPNICSVRSCRYYYPLICLGLDAIYCHWGADQSIAQETLNRTGIDHLDGGNMYGRMFFRDPNRVGSYASEHTGYLDGAKLAEYINSSGMRTDKDAAHQDQAFRFVPEDQARVPEELSATQITLTFSGAYYSTFNYDPESGTYLKKHSGSPHMDQATGNQLSFKNVFALQADVHPREDNYHMDVILTEGTGFYATNGGMQPIKWRKESETAPLRVYNEAGEELNVNPGKSYIGILGFDSPISYS